MTGGASPPWRACCWRLGACVWIVDLLPKYNLIETQALHQISINFPVLAFAVALAIVTGTVVGIVPALRVSGVNLSDSMKLRGRLSTASARGSGVQRALIVSEVALALALLIGAGLIVGSFERLQAAPMGFNPDHLLTVRVPLVNYKYAPGLQPRFSTARCSNAFGRFGECGRRAWRTTSPSRDSTLRWTFPPYPTHPAARGTSFMWQLAA